MAHIHELIDFVVNVYIVYDKKVLLVDHHKRYGVWLPIGGHIELHEDPEEALLREIKEECGLEVEIIADKPIINRDGLKTLFRPSFLDIHKANEGHRHVALSYIAKAKTDKMILSEEHNDIKWFSEEELHDPKYNILEDIKYYSKEAIKAVK